jgi:hypothetical protein
MIAASFVLVFGTVAGACSNSVDTDPIIEGTLSVNETPAAGADVYWGFTGSYDQPCSTSAVARTDADGNFKVPRSADQSPSSEAFLCFKHKAQLIVAAQLVSRPPSIKRYSAKCRWPVPAEAVQEDMQVCQWTAIHG